MSALPLATAVADDPDSFIDERDRRRLGAFCRRMVHGYIGGSHIDRLIAALEAVERGEVSRLIVTMPPRHSKSLNVSENFPAWFLGRNPDKRIIAASHTAQLAYTFSRRVRNKIADPRYPFAVTVADDKGGVQAWDTDAGGGYLAVGAGGSPTGHGGDGIVIDDPIRSAADADSETVREGLWEWYQGTLRTRLQPGGWIILTATRWHHDDLTGRLLAEMANGGESWTHLHLPAVDDDDAPLWPEFWSADDLAAIRVSVGSRVWQSQYMGAPTPTEGGILKRHWFGVYAQPERYLALIQSWDTAFKDGRTSDYSACVTLGVGLNYVDVLDVYRARIEFPDLERALEEQHLIATSRFPGVPITVLVEDKGSGQSLIQVARRRGNRNLNVIAVSASRPDEKV
ncbi:MAG: terminase family protein, partial [Thermomicrobiales bacterium]